MLDEAIKIKKETDPESFKYEQEVKAIKRCSRNYSHYNEYKIEKGPSCLRAPEKDIELH